MSRRAGTLRKARDAGQDLIRGSGPDEGFWIFVVNFDVFANGGFEFFHTTEDPTTNPLVGDFGKPALHEVDPRPIGRGEVGVKAVALGKPVPDHRRFVRSIVVHDDVNIDVGGHIRFDGVQKLAEFLRAEAAMELADHPVGLQLQRGEQRRGSIAFVVMRAALHLPWPHG